MKNNGDPLRRSDVILYAIQRELEQFRPIIDGKSNFSKLVITVHLASGGGHPRGIQCTFDHQAQFDATSWQLPVMAGTT
jgi:hypothetical protein